MEFVKMTTMILPNSVYENNLLSWQLINSSCIPVKPFVVIAERISARLWMRDLFSQCKCVRTCRSRSGMSICTHLHSRARSLRNSRVTGWRLRSRTGKNGASWQWRTGRTAQLVLRNVHVLRNRVLNVADGWRHWESNEVNVQKKPRGKEENTRKCKGRNHVVESLHKPGINYARFHVRFNRSPSD